MRPEGRLKAGFFPLPLAEAERVRRFLQFEEGHTSALDPCIGEGAALAAIASGRDVTRYGIELDAYRAERARTTCNEIIQGNALDVTCPVGSFSLVYENPPYDWDIGEGRNRRIEVVFLEHTYRWLKPEGVLILVVPAERVAECGQILAGQFKNVRLYRLTEPASQRYRQVVVVGVRRSQRERERLQDSEITRARGYYSRLAYNADQIPNLTDEPDYVYRVPAGDPVKLSYRGLPLDLIEDLLPKSPAYRQAARILFADEEPIEGRPLTPLHGGHVRLLCTAGMLNGIFGQGQSRHIAHWQSVKIVDKTEEQNEDGTLTIREKERFANELTLAFANGKVTTLRTLRMSRRRELHPQWRRGIRVVHVRLGRRRQELSSYHCYFTVTSDSDFVRPCPTLSRLRVHRDPDRSEGLQNRCMECAEDANKVSDGELGFDLDCGSDRVS